jgi:hypothetical protein
MIPAWSWSRLEVYESCPYRAYLQYVEKIPTPPLVPPEGKEEHPLTRGVRVHQAAEDFVTRDILLIDELKLFEKQFEQQRVQYQEKPQACIVEAEWAINQEWQPTGWRSKDTWGRMKLDWGYVDGPEMTIVDYKTGKKYATKHVQQGQLYALAARAFFPDVERFNVAFWYLDQEDTLEQSYSQIQVDVLRDSFDRRAKTMTLATKFKPYPSAWACRFCPYGEGKDGNKHCEYRYSYDN